VGSPVVETSADCFLGGKSQTSSGEATIEGVSLCRSSLGLVTKQSENCQQIVKADTLDRDFHRVDWLVGKGGGHHGRDFGPPCWESAQSNADRIWASDRV
jgi:hypothetical protein